ncbi:PREDICTED: U-box domain-containing protein 44-like [Erythranthe guttata]|nr:PREDICTED: U-box domain-containing protein 44-like [Erythranthe guttata]|eukprot:XP_012830700.1 PREDICTED: U-box domain-containing protein 44-like [Erythranthe guttata]
MKGSEFLSALVKSLARDVDERREAVGLLLNLCSDFEVRRRIGRIRGCIVMLVSISNNGSDDNNREDDDEASCNARMLLSYMSGNTQHALHMAEAGYFKPMIKYLIEGSEMSKVIMATAISRLELTDQNKASLGKEGAIAPLIEMFKTGNLEAKLSSLNALESLSNSEKNIQRLIHSGIVVALMQLLFSVTSVLMTLREPASAILAKVAKSEGILVKHEVVQQMLSLLNLSSPVIQNHLLEALNNIVSHSSASKIRKKMKENGAIQLVVPFFNEKDARIRTGALRLVHMLSEDIQGELIEELDYSQIRVIANIVVSSSDCERAAALGILSNLPLSDRKTTEILKNENLLPLVVSIMSSLTPQNSTPKLVESISGVLLRFTVSTDKRLQRYSAENGVIPILIKMLSTGSEASRSKAALSLAQLSQNTLHLSKSRKLKWFCGAPSVDSFCEVHDGYCSAKSTFCLVKSGAVTPLVEILEGEERGADEAVLSCLSTLLQDEIWESGSNYLAKKSSVCSVIRVLESGSFKAKEKCIWILERVFRVEALREEYGESAQMVLIDIAQNGDPLLASGVAKLLAQLDLLQYQSTYF